MAETTRISRPVDLAKQRLIRDIAKFVKDKIGKGPDNLEVEIGKSQIICLFKGFLTKAEELLVISGDAYHVCYTRKAYQKQCMIELESIVEVNLNRKIKWFFDCYTPEKDLACWTIFLD